MKLDEATPLAATPDVEKPSAVSATPAKALVGSPMKRALVLGIDNYPAPNHLDSCVNDAVQFSQLLKVKYGFDDSSINMLLDEQVTVANVKAELQTMFQNVSADSHLVFY